MSKGLEKKIQEQFPFLKSRISSDCLAFDCPSEHLIKVARDLKETFGFDLLLDVTAADWGEDASSRYSTFYHFLSTNNATYLRLCCDCVSTVKPSVPSLVQIYPAANWHERETYDMFGIHFDGHPDLRRILMWDSYPYFPLRKDFPLAGIETELPSPDVAERTGAAVDAAPMMGGPFVAGHGGVMSESEPRGTDESWNEKLTKPEASSWVKKKGKADHE